MASSNLQDIVEVSSERFEQLEELEKNLPELIKQAIANYKKENLRKLHEKDKNNPEGVKNRVKKYISKNKDKINERRREKRKEKILLENQQKQRLNAAAMTPIETTMFSAVSAGQEEQYQPSSGLTVRFND
jgi:hypothetical protein